MTVKFHFKDGSSVVVEGATQARPMRNADGSVNNTYVEAITDMSVREGLASVENLQWVEFV